MTILIKGIKRLYKKRPLSKKGIIREAAKNKPKLDPVKRTATLKRTAGQYKSLYGQKRLTAVGGAGTKGPVPAKKQSKIKSTLSGRTYSINPRFMSPKMMLDIAGGGFKSTPTSRFQDSVRNLIGLDSVSVRKAQLSYLRNRNRRKNRLKKK
jgi:hypothetical protein